MLQLILIRENEKTNKLSVGLDFTFNTLRNVHRVPWKEDAPWFREVADGMTWFAYCKNTKCKALKQLFTVSRGFGLFKMSKEVEQVYCPVCQLKNFELRNVGFVNCEWVLKGRLQYKADSRVFGEGQTYDGKLYTFKEANYTKVFDQLEIMAKRLKDNKIINNSKSCSESEVSITNRQMCKPGEPGANPNQSQKDASPLDVHPQNL